MALPRPNRPTYNATIPSSGKKIKYQPFTVREEKVLVLAAEGKDNQEIANAVTQCLQNCVTSPTDINIDELALFDIEYLFLKCRAKSIGEKLELRVTDPGDPTFTTEVSINVDKIAVSKNPEHEPIVKIDDEMSLKMKYPGIEFFTEGVALNNIKEISDVIVRCFESLIVGEEVYHRDDLSEEEILEWVEGLNTVQFNKLSTFFLTMPRLSHKLTVKNTNTNKNFTILLEGLADFF